MAEERKKPPKERKVIMRAARSITFDGSVRERGEVSKDIVGDTIKEMVLDLGYQLVRQGGMYEEDVGEVLDRVLAPTKQGEMAPSEKLKAMLEADPDACIHGFSVPAKCEECMGPGDHKPDCECKRCLGPNWKI
jgi:hypothetical protein